MSLLLDTNVILFGLLQPKRIRPSLKARLTNRSERVFVSVASIYEIGFKAHLGKLPLPDGFDVQAHVLASDMELLSITAQHAKRASQLPLINRDPWDRIIAAQAICESLSLVTADTHFEAFGLMAVW